MDPMNPGRAWQVLLVEDSASDAKMVLQALKMTPRRKDVSTSPDGEHAMAYLAGQADGAGPDLILLDLNLPKKDGWQVLAECKGSPRLRSIPIVVFSTSEAQQDVDRCYSLGANSFVTKPFDLDAFQRAIWMIEEFWLGLSAPWVQG